VGYGFETIEPEMIWLWYVTYDRCSSTCWSFRIPL